MFVRGRPELLSCVQVAAHIADRIEAGELPGAAPADGA
jgi:hypothetical protein